MKTFRLLPLYLRREPTCEPTSGGPQRFDVVAYSTRKDAKVKSAKARWLWHQSTKPTRSNQTVTLNCFGWRPVWLPDETTPTAAALLAHAPSNAARIAFELALRGNVSDVYGVLDEVSEAAKSLAQCECEPGFAWNEDGRTDWETVCAALAVRIERGLPVTVGAARRCIAWA